MPISKSDEACTSARTTVYFDGSCPLCSLEIAHYRRLRGADALHFVDVSDARTCPGEDLTREAALARFHIRRSDGTLLSGAAAFVDIWRQLPAWAWAARLASLPGMVRVMEGAYRVFLRLRPLLARLVRAFSRGRP